MRGLLFRGKIDRSKPPPRATGGILRFDHEFTIKMLEVPLSPSRSIDTNTKSGARQNSPPPEDLKPSTQARPNHRCTNEPQKRSNVTAPRVSPVQTSTTPHT